MPRELRTVPLVQMKEDGHEVGLNMIVKGLRRRADLTITDLAARAGIAVSTVSKIEAGQLLPGYETIIRLAVGLNVDVADLFQPNLSDVPTARRGVTRYGQGVKYQSPHYEYEALASDVSKKHFLPLRGTIRARHIADFTGLPSHEGEEFIYVISGSIRLFSDHYEPLDLAAGDSVYIDSRSGHALISTSEEDAEVVWVCSDREVLRRNRSEDGKEATD